MSTDDADQRRVARGLSFSIPYQPMTVTNAHLAIDLHYGYKKTRSKWISSNQPTDTGEVMFRVDIDSKKLLPLRETTFASLQLSERYDIQEWIESHPRILGEDLLIIGKELVLPSDERLDLLALDSAGNIVVVELKRDDSGSKVDWQATKYASYFSNLTEEDIYERFASYAHVSEQEAQEKISEFVDIGSGPLNEKQRIILCARQFRPEVASAVLWLRENGVDISCVKLEPYLTETNALYLYPVRIIPLPEAKDYVEKKERKEKVSKERPDFSPYLYVNVGEGPHRNWDDYRKYGFLSAGGGPNWSNHMKRLKRGDIVFAYLKGRGFVGCGVVLHEAMPAREFVIGEDGLPLSQAPLVEPNLLHNADDDEKCEWLAPVRWHKAVGRENARTFSGIFTHPSVVARMRKGETVDFLIEQFGLPTTTGTNEFRL